MVLNKEEIKGNSNTISTSKTKNKIEIKKKRIEKGIRALILGVNPHSNGLFFSRSRLIFILKVMPTKRRTLLKTKTKINPIKKEKI